MGSPRSVATRAKISAAMKGYVKSPEHQAKITESGRGRTVGAETRAKQSAVRKLKLGPLAPRWRGDDVGYGGIHLRARGTLPRICAHCGTTEGHLEAALKHDSAPEGNLRKEFRGGRFLVYSISLDDYMRLCAPCHKRFDLGERTG